MNIYEKHLFIKYLNKLLPSVDFDCYNFGRVFDIIVEEFNLDKSIFEFDKYGNIKVENLRQVKEFIKKLKRELKKYEKTHKPKSCPFEKKMKILSDIYKLTDTEYELVLFFAIKEINRRFDTFFDTLRNDSLDIFTNKYLGLRQSRAERMMNDLAMRGIVSKLRRGEHSINPKIIEVLDDENCNTLTKIVNVLLGENLKTTLCLQDFEHLKKEKEKTINILKSAVKTGAKGINILLYGGVGTGKTEFAKLIANTAKFPIYAVATEKDDLYEEASRKDRLVDLYSKQLILSRKGNACILFDEAEDVMNRGFSEFGSASKGYMNKLLEEASLPIIWTTNNIHGVDPAFLRRMTYCIRFEKLTDEVRLNIWNKVLKKNDLVISPEKVEELNKNYDIPPSLIANAVQTTKMIGGDENDFEEFIENVAQAVSKKSSVKNKKEFEMKEYDESLVNTDINIQNLTSKIKSCGKLNFSLCLYGEPGTGKSLYLRYLADQLGLKVIMKRASDLISMWVGGTEHNIAEAFAEAKQKKAMLIFDEADSFLQNRSNAVRRWEVSQVNEMLTWMESHEYPFACTTNLIDTLDEASLRRFTFKIKFDFMTPEQVTKGIEHFFSGVNTEGKKVNINGLTAGDFATVKKKTDFLGINDLSEIVSMLEDEVKIKKSKSLKNAVGF